ncbi:MAG: hypothetical protein VX473_02060 [Candidatus Thermoplasmatota archaeon]|nr:hypothetical protein [Candidatus Thermoplasmatota archaeon]
MKWGGGLITDKSSLCTPNMNNISKLANIVGILVDNGHSVIIVHGAGSFGHMRAREYRLQEGNIEGLDQYEAIDMVRNDMDKLNDLIVESLIMHNPIIHSPRDFVRNTGANFEGDLSPFISTGVHITFGDVVDCDSPHDFGILSGDDLMYRLGTELPDVSHVIFALGGTPGLMTSPDSDAELIPIWNEDIDYGGHHESDIDVTGGIFLKTKRAAEISKYVADVWFVDGCVPDRIIEIVDNGHTIGTKINPA